MAVLALATEGLKLGLIEFSATTIFQWANTMILFLILKKILFVPVTEFMAKREATIKNSFKEAEDLQNEANGLIKEYKGKLSGAELEGKEIIKQAVSKAEKRSLEIVRDAENDAKAVKDKAQHEIEREKVKAINTIKDEIADMAILAASKLIEKNIDADQNKVMIEKFINEVGDQKWQN